MGTTTKQLILDTAPELSTATDLQFQSAIDVAKQVVTYEVYGAKQQIAQTYCAAHILTEMTDTSGGGGGGGSGLVTMEKVGDIEKRYDVTTTTTSSTTSGQEYSRTKYGRIFLQLEEKIVRYT